MNVLYSLSYYDYRSLERLYLTKNSFFMLLGKYNNVYLPATLQKSSHETELY